MTTKDRRRVAGLAREHRQLGRANALLKEESSPTTVAPAGRLHPRQASSRRGRRSTLLLVGRVLRGGRGPPLPLAARIESIHDPEDSGEASLPWGGADGCDDWYLRECSRWA
jgi:hypothetical protein